MLEGKIHDFVDIVDADYLFPFNFQSMTQN